MTDDYVKGKYAHELVFAIGLAREAGKIMERYFRAEDIGTEWKEDNTPVTIADAKINDLVIERVKKAFPGHDVIGEEASFEAKDGKFVWVVDPIDGTKPFSLGMPVSTFLLALVNRTDGQPLIGVVYDPYLDHMYTATKGGGAYLNNRRLKTSKATSFFKGYTTVYGSAAIKTSTINYQSGKVIDSLHTKGASVLNLSSGAYTGAKIASGEFLALVDARGKPWDSAALCVLVQEAGGVVTDLEGKQRRFDKVELGCVLAANQTLLLEMLGMIKGDHENSRH